LTHLVLFYGADDSILQDLDFIKVLVYLLEGTPAEALAYQIGSFPIDSPLRTALDLWTHSPESCLSQLRLFACA